MQNLKTDWKTIGSSGRAIDGRELSPDILKSAAKNYDSKFFAALMFPDHDRYYMPNFGKVEEVRILENDDKSVSLQAIIIPNENYIYANRNGQYLYNSMELRPDFPNKGEWYLSGCAPTDSPALPRVDEIRFTADNPAIVISPPVELKLGELLDDTHTNLFSRLFSRPKQTQGENDMSKEALKALEDEIKKLQEEFTALKPKADDKPNDDPLPAYVTSEQFKALETKLDGLLEKFTESSKNDDKKPDTPDAFKALETKFADLEQKFTAALNEEHPGNTKPPRQTGANEFNAKDYL